MSRRLFVSVALLVIATSPEFAFAQSSILRGALLSGGGQIGTGQTTVRSAFGESFVTVPGTGQTNVLRAGLWLPQTPAPTGIDDLPAVIQLRTALEQNFPNPFNPRTVISFSLANSGEHVRLTIYNVAGRKVRTLVDGPMPGGPHVIVWNGTDGNQRSVASGAYLYVLETPDFRDQRKLTLVR